MRDTEKPFETAITFIKTAETRVNALKWRVNNAFHNNKNNNKNIIKII
jgi:hypothetical protein